MHLINLPRHTERLSRMQTIGAELGIDWQVFPAIDALDADLDLERWDPEGQMKPPEVACFLSHRRLWEQIADGDEPMAAIFEDDLHIAPGLRELVAQLPVPTRPTIYRLETDPVKIHLRSQPTLTVANRELHSYQGWVLGSAAYVLDRSAARALIARSTRMQFTVDLFLHNVFYQKEDEQIERLVTIPAPCIQDKMYVQMPGPKVRLTRKEKYIREARRVIAQASRAIPGSRHAGLSEADTPSPPPTQDYLASTIEPTHFLNKIPNRHAKPQTFSGKIVRLATLHRLRWFLADRRHGIVRRLVPFG